MRVLLLEDDRHLRTAYANCLIAAGGEVDEVGTLADAQRALGRTKFDCLVLDRLVPDGDAASLVGEIDRQPDRPPVLMISGLGDAAERLRGLISGADDYLVKPFLLDELALRVRKLVDAAPSSAGVLHLGRVRLDRHHRNVTCDGSRIPLTPIQFKLLELLSINLGSAVTTDELYHYCWDAHARLRQSVVLPHISRLRRKFEGYLTIAWTRGVGYTLRIAP